MQPSGNIFKAFSSQGKAGRLKNMVLLGLDYGRRRIGLAIAVNLIIETRGWLERDRQDREDQPLLKQIEEICCREGVEKVVVGISEGLTALETKRFVKKLSEVIKLPIVFVDETLTSWEAEKKVGWKDKGRIDTVAAALILERSLEASAEAENTIGSGGL